VNKKIIITKRIINPSIVFDKFLLAYNELSNSKDTSVLVILGENKSGKTTLRHYLSKK
jgi:polynucleotide 5'-kinase involved in rRNA processing